MNVGSNGNCRFIYETPPKTRSRHLTRLSHQHVQGQVNGNELNDSISPGPAGVISPDTSGSNRSSFSSRLNRKLLNESTPSTPPSWHEGVDGPLTPMCSRSVNYFVTPRTPLRPSSRKIDDANTASKQIMIMTDTSTPTPKIVFEIGKTCKKWMKSMTRKSGRKTRTVTDSSLTSVGQSPV